MSDRLDWFPCNPSKLLGALASMRAPEGYVYTVVLLRIYESGGACRDTLDAISVRTKLNKRVVSEALDSLFRAGRLVRSGEGITNPNAVDIIAESKALREKRKTASQIAGLASAEKRKGNQREGITKRSTDVERSSTPLQLQEQDSLFTNVNRALPETEPKPAKAVPKPPRQLSAMEIARKELFDRGKEVLGAGAGGMIQNLLAAKHGNIALARAAIEQASTMDNPRQYVGGILNGGGNNGANRNGGGKLGFAGIAEQIRRGSQGADGQAAFFGDAGDHGPEGGHRDPAVRVERVERTREAPFPPPAPNR